MDEHALRALVIRLRTRVDGTRAARGHTPGLMPDDADLVGELAALADECRGETDPRFFWVVVGLLLYGEPGAEFAPARVEHAVGYVCRWERRNRAIVFRGPAILQLVFLYALGVRRPPGPVAGETPAQSAAWGGAPWCGAFDALRWYLIGLAGWMLAGLRRLGFQSVELLGEFAGDPDGAYARRLADHSVGVLLGHTRCVCAPLFRAAHPGTPAEAPERRHDRWHLLSGYLDKHWPEGRRYDLRPFGVCEHVFRAVCGDEPTRPRAFETGIWFSLLRSSGASLAVLKVLTCRECRSHLAGFEVCPGCDTPWPANCLADWLASEEDARFRPGEGKECRRCGRLAPLERAACVCGSPGVGFTPTVRGTGRVECRACRRLQPRRAHACGHPPCLNADFGRVTRFYFRQEVPDRYDQGNGPPPGGPHRGRGRRRPLAPKPQERDRAGEPPPEQDELPGSPYAASLGQTPVPVSVAMTIRTPPRAEHQPPTDSAPDPSRAGTPAAGTPEGSDS